MRTNAKIEMMRRIPLFAGCTKRELTEIATIADEVHFRPGRQLMKEGAPGREFVVVLEGTVEMTIGGRVVPVRGGTFFFGEIALLSDSPRTATITTTSTVRALVVTGRAFRRLLKDSPQIEAKVLAGVAERLAPDVPRSTLDG